MNKCLWSAHYSLGTSLEILNTSVNKRDENPDLVKLQKILAGYCLGQEFSSWSQPLPLPFVIFTPAHAHTHTTLCF